MKLSWLDTKRNELFDIIKGLYKEVADLQTQRDSIENKIADQRNWLNLVNREIQRSNDIRVNMEKQIDELKINIDNYTKTYNKILQDKQEILLKIDSDIDSKNKELQRLSKIKKVNNTELNKKLDLETKEMQDKLSSINKEIKKQENKLKQVKADNETIKSEYKNTQLDIKNAKDWLISKESIIDFKTDRMERKRKWFIKLQKDNG